MKVKNIKGLRRRIACIGLTLAFGTALAAGQAVAFAARSDTAAEQDNVHALSFENANGKIDLTKIKYENLSSSVITDQPATKIAGKGNVIVGLTGQSILERGDNSRAAEAQIKDEQNAFLNQLDKAGVEYTLRDRYSSVLNGVSIDVDLGQVTKIKALKGVATVTAGSTYERPKAIETSEGATQNYSKIYDTGIYDSYSQVGEGHDGRGMTVAVLDTGLDYTHEAFRKDPIDAFYTPEMIESLMANSEFAATRLSGATYRDVYVSAKVPFAYDYADNDADVYPSYSQHGTHVAGIVAGDAESYVNKAGEEAFGKYEEGFKGVAPEAQLVICKVFTDDLDDKMLGSAETSDILSALDDCCKLNVDVINMSLGTSAGFSSKALGLTEEDSEGHLLKQVYDNIRNKGISLFVAASNEYSAGYGSAFGTNKTSNPDSGTIGSPSTFTGALSIASVNGQYAPYLTANTTEGGVGNAIYYEESRNADSDAYSFINDLIGCNKKGCTDGYHERMGLHDAANYKQSATFKYVVVPGTGEEADYFSIKSEFNDPNYDKVIAVIKRGSSSFQNKIDTARKMGADAAIVYNNVSGMLRMSLGDLKLRIPAIFVSYESGLMLTAKKTGTITVDRSHVAGPFMNDYSSWGVTPDLQLKPDVTSHGGEIISAVAGGYQEMSGTSMACPNLAGFAAVFKGYLKGKPELWQKDGYTAEQNAFELTKLTNNIIMSTATTVYDQSGLPYSPRKQGAGLATLDNVFATGAYLDTYTDGEDKMCEDDGRPKAELGEDAARKGEYRIVFRVNNFSGKPLTFKTQSMFMTESVGVDGMSVAEKAHPFGDDATWTVDGVGVAEGGEFTVTGASARIEVTLKLTKAEKKYLDDNFKNGMFVEGFLKLKAVTAGQCDLTLPFMGFYGSWKDAPMMDLDAFQVADDAKDTSIKEENKRQPNVWATQAYGMYAGYNYSFPLGSFVYVQDESKQYTADYIYPNRDYVAVSRDFHEYNGPDDPDNYLTITGFKALYAGLLRNAELVTYTISNVDTGEVLTEKEVYRCNKSYAGGGSATPSQVLLELLTEDMGVVGNGKYKFDFAFYFDYEDYKNGTFTYTDADGKEQLYGVYKDNTYSMEFYVDYEAPVLVDSRIRFQDLTDSSNKLIQKVYLDLDVFDNHYPQAVVLCYSEKDVEETDMSTIKLATEYITPVKNPVKNGITTVSIEITDFYEEYKGRLYVELDDYALNHNTYIIDTDFSKTTVAPDDFSLFYKGAPVPDYNDGEISIELNTAEKFTVEGLNGANISNLSWEVSGRAIKVKDGEIFGVRTGTSVLTVRGGVGANGRTAEKLIRVRVTNDADAQLGVPTISFGAMVNYNDNLVKAEGTVVVNPAQKIKLSVEPSPWYYPLEELDIEWSTNNPALADVDENGNVVVKYEGDLIQTVVITAQSKKYPSCSTSVTLAIRDAYFITNNRLTKYRGWGCKVDANGDLVLNEKGERVLVIPNDKAIMTIGEDAFEDTDVEVVVVPKSVTTIEEGAFTNCKSLKRIAFIKDTDGEEKIADASLNLIRRYAFKGCDNLETVDLSSCKVITLDTGVFAGCTKLSEIIKPEAIGTMNDEAFRGCTALESIDLTGLHMVGRNVFADCTHLSEITIGKDTAIGNGIFRGCTALTAIEINCDEIGANAFANCTNLESVTLNANDTVIGASAFAGCSKLTSVILGTVNSQPVRILSIGSYAFRNCSGLQNAAALMTADEIGLGAFENVGGRTGAIVNGNVLVKAPDTVTSNPFAGIENPVVGSYAFAESVLSGIETLDLTGVTLKRAAFYNLRGLKTVTIPEGVEEIPDYAFYGCTNLTTVTLPASLKTIGNAAFMGCSSLTTVQFAQNGNLEKIGSNAFRGVAITSLTLPEKPENAGDGAKFVIGDAAFMHCSELVEVTIPFVTEMGVGAFAFCPKLASAEFGADAQTVGDYAFFGATYSAIGWNPFELFDQVQIGTQIISQPKSCDSALTQVVISDKIKRIGAGAFAFTGIITIDLTSVTEVGEAAFFNCQSLATVGGADKVKLFEAYAFAYCGQITSLNLSAAEGIYARAFINDTALASVTFGDKLDGIGDEAFAESAISEVLIPASCTYVGVSAFSGCSNLSAYTVEEGSANYVAYNGVLYRYIDKQKGVYELCSYPCGKYADISDGVRTYRIIDGTITIQAFAFYNLPSTLLKKVIMPYTLKTIGDAAFFNSQIDTYQFESIQAPALLEGIANRLIASNYFSGNSFFYKNFGINSEANDTAVSGDGVGRYLLDVVKRYAGYTGNPASRLTIYYPANGRGYDSFIYSSYFGAKNVLSEMLEDDTRALISILEGLPLASAVSGWNKSNQTQDFIKEFAETVKTARGYTNNLTEAQRELVTQNGGDLDRLTEVETALRPVKKTFNIPVIITRVDLDTANSTHKTEYVAGERFSLSGLKIAVTYDDFSKETVDAAGNFKVRSSQDRALTTSDSMITLEGTGAYDSRSVRVRISVAASGNAGNTGSGATSSKGGTLGTGAKVGIAVGCAAAVIIAVLAVLFVLIKKGKISIKRNKKEVAGEEGETVSEEADGESQTRDDSGEDKTND